MPCKLYELTQMIQYDQFRRANSKTRTSRHHVLPDFLPSFIRNFRMNPA